jgi:hypothetical protein
LAAGATVLGLVAFIVIMVRRETHNRPLRRSSRARCADARFQLVHRRPRD